MSLKRRNFIALILALLAAFCWTFGQQALDDGDDGDSAVTSETSIASVQETLPTALSTEENLGSETVDTTSTTSMPSDNSSAESYDTDQRPKRALGFVLSAVAVLAAFIAVFALSQKNPVCGPDSAFLALSLLATANRTIRMPPGAPMISAQIAAIFLALIFLRELFGWMRSGFALSWCLVQRTAMRCKASQMSLLIFALWVVLSLSGVICLFVANIGYMEILLCIFGYLISALLGILCLWKYGRDLDHFKRQLDNYRQGKPVTVGSGAFSQTEAQLLDVQAKHEEAVRTAVTSERFKVELISNVSHDLRTPLTSILGYSELLQTEKLSQEGQQQLRRLHAKAGYMNDLVESLFELTKVSSGVVEAKKDKIDLVRLLEQTIGLYDDHLTNAGLSVRRSYCSDTIPVVTDGARMHQVFANLLGNAIKYALAGTRIYLDIRETESSYLVRMMNTASYEMDFKPDEIMQRFARGDKARSTKGSGLGLAIAQTYTESVGGIFRVSVDGDQFSAVVELPKTERNL